MRVTRAIREYVEQEIYKKYQDAQDEIGKDYFAEREEVTKHIIDIMKEASKKAEEFAESKGFECNHGYRDMCLFHLSGTIDKPEISQKINEERNKLRHKEQAKIKQVLFDLEMGDTDKAKLKEVLDNIIVD